MSDEAPDETVDETSITEITIHPDGRVYVFGTSRGALELLEQLRPDDPKVRLLLGRVRELETCRR